MSAKKKKTEEQNASDTVADVTEELAECGTAEALEELTSDELGETRDRLLRLQADFDNFRKRTQRERAEISQRANEAIMEELLPVLDHFEMGLKTAEQHNAEQSVIDGFELVYNQTLTALRKFGLEPVDAEGQAFDPHWHEAVTHMPSEEHPADMVIAQTRRGYRLGEKLLRAAQVVVSSGSAERDSAEHVQEDSLSQEQGE